MTPVSDAAVPVRTVADIMQHRVGPSRPAPAMV
jgi:hypothetical protein